MQRFQLYLTLSCPYLFLCFNKITKNCEILIEQLRETIMIFKEFITFMDDMYESDKPRITKIVIQSEKYTHD